MSISTFEVKVCVELFSNERQRKEKTDILIMHKKFEITKREKSKLKLTGLYHCSN